MGQTVKINSSSVKSATIANGSSLENRYFDLSVTQSDGNVAYLDVDKDTIKVTTYKDGTWTDVYTLATKVDLESRVLFGSNNRGFYIRLQADDNHKIQFQTFSDGSKFEISVYENGIWTQPAFAINKS